MPTVKVSWRTSTPSTAATAGFTYVMTVARTGPISVIRAANRRNAAAVQTIARVTTEASTSDEGIAAGRCATAIGAYTSAHNASESAITPTEGRPPRRRERIAGPTA
ncbi:MAG TPA: hypothetical protein VIK16_05260 [Candidatus Limnocylindrales bacterium]